MTVHREMRPGEVDPDEADRDAGNPFDLLDEEDCRFGELIVSACLLVLGVDVVGEGQGDVGRAVELKVRRATAEMADGTQVDDDPKSAAGKRPIAFPSPSAPMSRNLRRFAEPEPTGRLFVGQGGIPRRRNFSRTWRSALARSAVPPPGSRLHDLRHTGSTSSQTGATLKEVMARIGHSSTRAAMIYQHATRDRDRAIADALDVLIVTARSGRA